MPPLALAMIPDFKITFLMYLMLQDLGKSTRQHVVQVQIVYL